MNTIALRFADYFAPECGTIEAHSQVIKEYGYVWYGKLGSKVSFETVKTIMGSDDPRILLINSGKTKRYWAYIDDISYDIPDDDMIPSYYREIRENFKTWFKVKKFVEAERNVMSKCIVVSSRQPLNLVSKASMSPYFKIMYSGEE